MGCPQPARRRRAMKVNKCADYSTRRVLFYHRGAEVVPMQQAAGEKYRKLRRTSYEYM